MSTAPASLSARADLVLAPPRRRLQPVALLALPGAGYLALAFAAPLALLLMASVISEGRPTLAGYRTFLADPFSWTVMANTIRSAGLITLICLVAGYPAAFALARAAGLLQAALLAALVLPLSVGVVVKAFAWTILLRSDGVVNRALVGLGAVDAPVRLLFTESGLVLGAVNVFLPFMVLPIFSVVKLIDPRLLDAAATLGSSPLHRFFRVTLPLTMPGVIAGVAFVFSMSVSMYVIPTLLMGDRFKTLSVLIARSFLFMRDRSVGSTASVMLLLIAVAVVVASALLTRRWQPSR
ncbi:MAG: ABC transporter permease [Candidatus Rokubacteria bacterium 13_1_20CM_4_68_9]|nr:MAG: ABC transporter permease [Candidatus Rokubacteria bacterium 13_1_20CM_4_68_9]